MGAPRLHVPRYCQRLPCQRLLRAAATMPAATMLAATMPAAAPRSGGARRLRLTLGACGAALLVEALVVQAAEGGLGRVASVVLQGAVVVGHHAQLGAGGAASVLDARGANFLVVVAVDCDGMPGPDGMW